MSLEMSTRLQCRRLNFMLFLQSFPAPNAATRLNIVYEVFVESNVFHLVNSVYKQLVEYLIHATFDQCVCKKMGKFDEKLKLLKLNL